MFPAPAGINRGRRHIPKTWIRVPRASGDKPISRRYHRNWGLCSPRQRG
ncbi:hypothetical protein CIT292_09834 [Citrobacter youngae ATCC 29220]|uniref:Uncharacterized protein n=1 Tax=Citrobacter youngae ATCC 29220 TaxID=500640 RepID=D4BH27_9ENTR|nr:hypothetical protein CIT292_09834 [Citrobacter youngae ATCC 29220]